MKIKICINKIFDIVFLLFICSLFDTLSVSIPLWVLCLAILIPNIVIKKFKAVNLCVLWYILFFSLFILGILWSSAKYIFWFSVYVDAIRIAQCLTIILWISNFSEKTEDIHKYINIYILAMIYLVLKLIILTPFRLWGTDRLGLYINIQPTMLGMTLALTSVSAIYLWSIKKNKLYLILSAIFTFVCAFSGSRNGFLVLLIGISLYFILSSKGTKLIKNLVIVVLLIGIVYFLIFNVSILYNSIGYRFENFLSENNTEQSSVERKILRESAIQLFQQHPLIGSGTEGFRYYASVLNLHRVTYSHCNYTEMLANYGIVGFGIYYIFQFIITLNLIKKFRINTELCYALVIFVIILVGDYGYISYFGIIQQYYIAIAYMIYKLNKRSNKKELS